MIEGMSSEYKISHGGIRARTTDHRNQMSVLVSIRHYSSMSGERGKVPLAKGRFDL